MKIYFACSARGTDTYWKNYKNIFDIIESLGHVHLDNYMDSSDPSKIYDKSHEESLNLYKKAMNSIKNCDVLVLEVSTHSLTMGYLMQQALSIGKPVIAMYVRDHYPAFVIGIDDEKLQVIEYEEGNTEEELRLALQNAQEKIDVRFNFFISPAIGRYLDWISKEKKIPRSVYLRALIEHEMRESKEYKE